MIYQKRITTKIDTATLTLVEMGDIVVNKNVALTITIPTASPYVGLWYYIINAGEGDCTVYEEGIGAIAVLLQDESIYLVSDGTSWYTGVGSKTGEYTFTQSAPAASWVITHNLHKHPSVTVVDSAGEKVYGNVTYNSQDQITIDFSAAFSGNAYLN